MTTAAEKLDVNKPIVLVGLMGAGKTSVGKRFAARLGLEFVDADAEVEAAAGLSIADIFAAYGEAAFRDCEKRVIARLLSGPVRVIATGGGAFVDPDTRALIKSKAISVWLRAPIPLLVERVSRRNSRPLLENADPKEVLTRLAADRDPYYSQADITVQSGDGPHEVVVKALVDALKAHLSEPVGEGRQS